MAENTTTEITLEEKQEWMLKCLKAGAELYGIIPWKILRKLYRKKYKADEAEVREVFESIDPEIRAFEEYEGEVVDAGLIGNDAYEMLKGYQEGKPFFIPNKREIEMIAQYGFINNTPEAKRMLNVIMKIFEPNLEEATKILDVMHRKISMNCMPSQVMKELEKVFGREFEFEREDDGMEFMEALMYFNNSTRMIIHRGNMPSWLSQNPGIGIF